MRLLKMILVNFNKYLINPPTFFEPIKYLIYQNIRLKQQIYLGSPNILLSMQ